MARTAVTITNLVKDGNVVQPAGTTLDQANGMNVATDGRLRKYLIAVTNTFAGTKAVTVRAGAAYPAGPAFQAGQGDLVINVAQNATQFIGPLSSARFVQADGSINLDF